MFAVRYGSGGDAGETYCRKRTRTATAVIYGVSGLAAAAAFVYLGRNLPGTESETTCEPDAGSLFVSWTRGREALVTPVGVSLSGPVFTGVIPNGSMPGPIAHA